VTIPASRRLPPTPYSPPLVSWEDYLPWALANEFPSEWVDGEIVDVLTSTLRHHDVTALLFEHVRHWVERHRLGLVIFGLLMRLRDRPSGRVPDVMYIANGSMDRLTDTYLDGPADLAVEVVSLDSLKRDLRDKYVEYEAAGVPEYWLIDEPHRDAHFYILGGDRRYHEASVGRDGIYSSMALPGLQLHIERLWHVQQSTRFEALDGVSSASDGVNPRRADHRRPDVRSTPSETTSVTIETNSFRGSPIHKPPLVTWEDFHDWALGQERRVEWVDGEIIELPPDNVEHFDEVDFLGDLIKTHVRRGRLGRVFYSTVLMRLPNRPSGRVPDVMFVANEHLERVRRTYVDGPADLVIEVVSPESEARDRFLKLGEYSEAKIPEYWLIDKSRREVYFHVLGEDGKYHEAPIGANGIYTSTILPSLRLRVEWLWRNPPPTLEDALADLRS
jgi:Uma2 family endonuclease